MRHWCSAGPSNVRVNAIAPGATKTNLADDSGGFNMNALPAAMEEQIASRLPHPGLVTAEDVAAAVGWLASAGARGVTGHVLPIDKGYTAAGYQDRPRSRV